MDENNLPQKVHAIATIGSQAAAPNTRRETRRLLCYTLGCEEQDLDRLVIACREYEGLKKRCAELETLVVQRENSCGCKEDKDKLNALWRYCITHFCPGNIPFSRVTIDDFSQVDKIELNKVLEEDGFENALPITPSQKIKYTHHGRLGFTPKRIRIDMQLANGGTNYLDIYFKFFLTPGEPGNEDQRKQIGTTYRGNEFLNKDGTQIELPWPKYRGEFIEVGFAQVVEVEIHHRGSSNNLESVMVRLKHDNEEWYELCEGFGFGSCLPKKRC